MTLNFDLLASKLPSEFYFSGISSQILTSFIRGKNLTFDGINFKQYTFFVILHSECRPSCWTDYAAKRYFIVAHFHT